MAPDSLKKCTVCKESKPRDFFYNYKRSKDGLQNRCKSCDNEAGRKYKELHYEHYLESQRRRNIKHKYDLTAERYQYYLDTQDSSCAICSKHVSVNNGPVAKNGSQRLAVDHCHTTKKIRGLLCNTCNRALGLLGDNPETVRKMYEYIKKHKD